MLANEIFARIRQELAAAEKARELNNEGKARVSARRAAGIAIQAYYRHTGVNLIETNVIHLLIKLKNDPMTTPEWKEFADLLLMRVTKNHTLPSQKDFLAETRSFITEIIDYIKKEAD